MTTQERSHRVLHEDWFQIEPAPALRGAACPACGARYFPLREVCPACGREPLAACLLPREGRVLASTVVHVAPKPWQAPYVVAAVDLGDGLVVYAHLIGERVRPGATVTLDAVTVQRADGDALIYGFRPDAALRGDGVETLQDAVTPAVPASAYDDLPPIRPLVAPVYLGGVGMTPFGKHLDVPAELLALRASRAAIQDSGLDERDIQAIFVGTAFGGTAMGQKLLRHAPWGGRPVINVENACASGSTALLEAAAWVASGRCDVALAVGVDTPASNGGGLIPLPEDDPLVAVGISLPALYALVADQYLHESGATARDLAAAVVSSRQFAAANPNAYMRTSLTLDEVMRSRPIADPLTLYQCAPNADGAAAVVVLSAARARRVGASVRLRAAHLRSGGLQSRFSAQSVVALAAQEAYEAAGIGPRDLQVAEIHDAYSSAVPLSLEKLGIAPHYEGAARLARGMYGPGGEGPTVNPSGGLLSRGHPPGATGLAQVFEVVSQLRGQAGSRQVAGVKAGVIQNQGGTVLDLETNAVAITVLTQS